VPISYPRDFVLVVDPRYFLSFVYFSEAWRVPIVFLRLFVLIIRGDIILILIFFVNCVLLGVTLLKGTETNSDLIPNLLLSFFVLTGRLFEISGGRIHACRNTAQVSMFTFGVYG